MKLRRLGLAMLWVLAAGLTALEASLFWIWLQGARYVAEYGAAENPYATEDMEIAGICALALLPLFLAAAWALCRIVLRSIKRAGARSER